MYVFIVSFVLHTSQLKQPLCHTCRQDSKNTERTALDEYSLNEKYERNWCKKGEGSVSAAKRPPHPLHRSRVTRPCPNSSASPLGRPFCRTLHTSGSSRRDTASTSLSKYVVGQRLFQTKLTATTTTTSAFRSLSRDDKSSCLNAPAMLVTDPSTSINAS